MSRYDAHDETRSRDPFSVPDRYQPDSRQTHRQFGQAIRRDLQQFVNEAEYEFRKIVAAPRLLRQANERSDALGPTSRSRNTRDPDDGIPSDFRPAKPKKWAKNPEKIDPDSGAEHL